MASEVNLLSVFTIALLSASMQNRLALQEEPNWSEGKLLFTGKTSEESPGDEAQRSADSDSPVFTCQLQHNGEVVISATNDGFSAIPSWHFSAKTQIWVAV